MKVQRRATREEAVRWFVTRFADYYPNNIAYKRSYLLLYLYAIYYMLPMYLYVYSSLCAFCLYLITFCYLYAPSFLFYAFSCCCTCIALCHSVTCLPVASIRSDVCLHLAAYYTRRTVHSRPALPTLLFTCWRLSYLFHLPTCHRHAIDTRTCHHIYFDTVPYSFAVTFA